MGCPLLWLPAWGGKGRPQLMNGAFPPAANWPTTLPNKVLGPRTELWREWGNATLDFLIKCENKIDTTSKTLKLKNTYHEYTNVSYMCHWFYSHFAIFGYKSKMCPYWVLSRTPRFLCCRGMLWITMRSFRLCWVTAAPTGTRPAWGNGVK